MNNIYSEALKNVSCLQELLYDDFSGRALDTATVVLDKGAHLYKVYGTNIALMAHSDQFGTTPDQISWYNVGVNREDSIINYIDRIDDDIKDLLPEVEYEEIMFFVKAAAGNASLRM